MLVSDIMTREVTTAGPDTTVAELAKTFSEKRIGAVPVIDAGGALVGIITESNLLPKLKKVPFSDIKLPALFSEWVDDPGIESIFKLAREKKAKDIMTTNVITASPGDSVLSAALTLGQRGFRRLPVIDEGKVVGIISRGDVLRALAKETEG